VDGHIDWVSWTEPTKREPRDTAELYTLAKQHLVMRDANYVKIIFDGTGFERTRSRAPYRLSLGREDHGCRIYGDSPTGTILFELSGRGCEALRPPPMGRWFIAGITDRITRLDYAVDIRTRTNPSEFTGAGHSQRFSAKSIIVSGSGSTVYIGSAKSDRYCRVYRYNPPHPRADLLRVEFVFRRGLAKAAAEDLALTDSDAQFAAQLGNTWAFQHADWQPGQETDERLMTPIVTRTDSDTLSWLYAQVMPAMKRLIASGALDLPAFVAELYDFPSGND